MERRIPLSEIKVERRHRKDMGDISGLAAGIEAVGLLQPIGITPDKRLVFGERRLRAYEHLYEKLGNEFAEIPARQIDIEAIVDGEFHENENRKDFTPEERVHIGRSIEAEIGSRQGQRGDDALVENFPQVETGTKTREIAATKAGFGNDRSYRQAREIVEAAEAEPERFGGLVADMNRTGRVNGPFKRLKVARQAELIRREPPPLPNRGPYRVVAADPAWPYELRSQDPSHRATHPYPQMSIEEICAVKVGEIAHKDSICWLWTTNHHLRAAFTVLDAWGFQQKTILTWVKDKFGYGDWLRGQTEHCLLAVRGKPTVDLSNQSTVLHAPMRANSQKPEEFYSFVERLCPAPRYAELFARSTRPNWDGHGDEVPRVV